MKLWQCDTKIKIGHISYKTTPKWRNGAAWPPKRNMPEWGERAKGDCIQRETIAPKYLFRMVKCNCGTKTWTDTTSVQMLTGKGMKAIVCAGCRRQSRTSLWVCECNKRWHRCNIHKVDPVDDGGRKKGSREGGKQLATAKLLSTNRPLPKITAKPKLSPRQANSAEEFFNQSLSFCKRKTKSVPHTPVPHFGLSAAACPRLAAKFARKHPHLFVQADDSGGTSPHNREAGTPQQAIQGKYGNSCVCKGQDCTANGLCSTLNGIPSTYVDRYNCSSGTMLPLREGSVRTESKAPPDPHRGRGECQA